MPTYVIVIFIIVGSSLFSGFPVLGALNNNSNFSTSISQDDNGQVSEGITGGIVGAIIGSILGAFATYLFALMIENRREKTEMKKEMEIRKRIVSLIRYELNVYSIYLQTHFRPIEDRISKEELLTNFKTLPRHYINMTPETKAKVFDTNTLKQIEKTYQVIQLYLANTDTLTNIGKAESGESTSRIKGLIDSIDQALKSISTMKIE